MCSRSLAVYANSQQSDIVVMHVGGAVAYQTCAKILQCFKVILLAGISWASQILLH